MSRTDIGPGPIHARLLITQSGAILRHARGDDRLAMEFSRPVAKVLVDVPLTWIVHERLGDGAVRAKPVLVGPLQSKVRSILEKAAEDAERAAERQTFVAAFHHGRSKLRKGHRQKVEWERERDSAWQAYNVAMETPDEATDTVIIDVLRTYRFQVLRPLIGRALKRIGRDRLVSVVRSHPSGWPPEMEPLLDQLRGESRVKQIAEQPPRPRPVRQRVDAEEERREHLRNLQRTRVEAPLDPMAAARRRIGPIQNYGDDT